MVKLSENIAKVFKQVLLNEARVLPSDADISACPSIYKGVRTGDVDSYIENGFNHQLAGGGGTAVGEGVYSRLELSGVMRYLYSYGPAIIQGKVLGGFKNYIMYAGNEFPSIKRQITRYYGSYLTPEEQIKTIVNDPDDADRLIRAGYNMNARSDTAKLCRKYGIRGLIYEWDGVATVLPFDFSSVIVWAVARNAKQDATLVRVFDNDARERYERSFDWDFQLYGRYDSYDRNKITRVATNNEMYALVQDRNRGYNFVELDTRMVSNPKPKEISDIWVSEAPALPSIKTGIYRFRYNGLNFFATVFLPGSKTPALWFPEDLEKLYSPDLDSVSDWVDLDKKTLDEVYAELKNLPQAYRIVSESLKNTFRKYLNEAIDEEIKDKNKEEFISKRRAYIYTATNSSNIPSIFANGMLRQFAGSNDGKWYGEGVYSKLYPNDSVTSYGNAPDYYKYDKDTHCAGIQSIVLGGFNNFLIFDENWANKVYGANHSLKDQVYKIFTDKEVADNVWGDFSAWIAGNTTANGVNWYNDQIKVHHTKAGDHYTSWPTDCDNTLNSRRGRTTGILHAIFDNSYYVSKYTKLFSRFNVRGTIYNGGNDGLCALCWNYDNVIPYRYTKDRGMTWQDDLFNFEAAKERSFKNTDPVSKFRHLYQYVSDKPIACNVNGTPLNVTTVNTEGRKWNIININDPKGRKISPIDFDGEPRVGLSGLFKFNYGGIELQGVVCLPGTNGGAVWYPEDISRLYERPDVNSLNDWVDFTDLDEVVAEIKKM